jgi:hypothetical protein
MNTTRNLLFATGLAALVGLAVVGVSRTHVVTVRLPDGATETIASIGSAPPRVDLVPRPVLVPLDDGFAPDPVFADLERTVQAMDRRDMAMIRASRALEAARFGDPGGLSAVTALAGPGVCVRSVEYHYAGDGRPPKVVSHVAGTCGPAPSAAPVIAPVIRPAPPAPIQAADRQKPQGIVA